MKRKNLYLFLVFFLLISISSSASDLFNVLDFGAVADGEKVNTEAIQKAIDKCSEKGGVVYFPSGDYVSGTLYFKDNVTLRIGKGATIWGSTDLADYPENLPDYSFFRKGTIKRALIYAEQVSNIAIEGEGTINGRGEHFLVPKDSKVSSYSIRPT
jgi:polygalacturonase